MATSRFLHLASKTYLGLYMPNPPFHDSNTSNPLTGINPKLSNDFNSNWVYKTKEGDPSHRTYIQTESWRIEDVPLFITAYNNHLKLSVFALELAARPKSTGLYENFYFKPKGIFEGEEIFQICFSDDSIEYFVHMKKLDDNTYNIRLIQSLSVEENEIDTLFKLERRA